MRRNIVLGRIELLRECNERIIWYIPLIVLCVLTPASLTHFIPGLTYLCFFCYFFLTIYLLLNKKIIVTPFIQLLLLFQLVFIISDILNYSTFFYHTRYLFINLFPCLYFTGCKNEKQKRAYLYSVIVSLRYLLILQLLSKLFFPQGLYDNNLIYAIEQYFLENDNSAMPFVYLLVVLSVYFKRFYSDTSYKPFFDLFLCFVLTYVSWSGTGIITMFLLLFSIIISNYPLKYNRSILVSLLVVIAVLFYDIVVNETSDIGMIRIISELLGKDISFSGRTYIWQQALSIISVHPIIGSGTSELTRSILSLGGTSNMGAHNQILQIVMEGGLLAAGALILLIIISIKINRKIVDDEYRKIIFFLYLCICAILVGMQMEIYTSGWILIYILAISYTVNNRFN